MKNLSLAIQDFRDARRHAALEQIMARLTGKSSSLLSYEEVRSQLKARSSRHVGLRDIPLDAIVGSVGRYTDFTRSFLPRRDTDAQRWTRVQMAVNELEGVPPIEVYKIGEAYFVRDGNHRVSVARQMEAPTIQAYVTEIETRVPLSPDTQPDELIIKAEYTDFLEQTNLDMLRPGADLSTTAPGRYSTLLDHIHVHQYFMGRDQQRDIAYEDAVGHWYDHVYMPVIQIIRERGILRDFPQRTETDLYLWLSEHRAELEEALGWEVETIEAADDLVARYSSRTYRVVARIGERLWDAVTPDELDPGPAPGQWRQEREQALAGEGLFADILVSISGQEAGWHALDQALHVAQREGGQVRGLHVVATITEAEQEQAHAVRDEFTRRCQSARVPGKLVIEAGKVARKICERSRWTDLVVLSLSHPPAPQPVARLSSGLHTVIRRCPRPILAVPGPGVALHHALLAYDGSPKADEALFVATYLAGRWGCQLTVLGVQENGDGASAALGQATDYLNGHDIQATYVQEHGQTAQRVLKTAEEHHCDLILMGGYGHSPMIEAVLGSAVDKVLRNSQLPILVCR